MTRSISQRAVRNTFSHYIGVAVFVATSFVVMPAIINGIGVTQFGIWAIANTLIGYSSILDLGLGQTLIKKTSELLAKGEFEQLNDTVGIVLTLYTIIAVVIIVAFLALAAFAPILFHIPPDLIATFRDVLLILGLVTTLGFPMSVVGGIVGGLQDFYVTNTLGAVFNVLKMIGTFALLDTGHGLVALVLLSSAISVLGWIGNYVWVRYRLPGLRFSLRRLGAGTLNETVRFTSSMFIWSVAGQALQSVDRIIVGLLLPVRFVGIYEVGARLNSYSRYAINVVFVAMPAASTLFAQGRNELLQRFYIQGTKLVFGIYGLIATGVLVLGAQFISLWVGPGFELSSAVAQTLVLATLFQSQNSLGHVVLVGMGRLRTFTIVMAAYPVLLIILCWALGRALGLWGVSLGVLAAVVILESVLLVHLSSVMSVRIPEILLSIHARVLPCMFVSGGLILLLNRDHGILGWSGFFLRALTLVGVYAGLFVTLAMSKPERRDIFARLGLITIPK